MRLYLAKGTISVAVAIAFEEAGVLFEPVVLEFATGAQTKAEYLAINPKGRVPALEVLGGILTETGAILEYVASLAAPKAAKLVPGDALAAARMREVMYYLATTMHVNHAHKLRGHRWADLETSHADMASKVRQTMAASSAYLEDSLDLAPFLGGAEVNLADCYLYVVCTWLAGDGVPIGDFPRLFAHHAAMGQRASVLAARAQGWL
jgi:glutathione S-transferase